MNNLCHTFFIFISKVYHQIVKSSHTERILEILSLPHVVILMDRRNPQPTPTFTKLHLMYELHSSQEVLYAPQWYLKLKQIPGVGGETSLEGEIPTSVWKFAPFPIHQPQWKGKDKSWPPGPPAGPSSGTTYDKLFIIRIVRDKPDYYWRERAGIQWVVPHQHKVPQAVCQTNRTDRHCEQICMNWQSTDIRTEKP